MVSGKILAQMKRGKLKGKSMKRKRLPRENNTETKENVCE
jgi:hypothetical protein